jgi:acyl-CoA synthetase (AMP-forming)/AMP-acid ligase II
MIKHLCPELADCAPGRVRSATLSNLRRVVCLGPAALPRAIESWDHVLSGAAGVSDEVLDSRAAEISPADDAVVIYTSGTSAAPKGVLHGHRAAALQSWRFARLLGLDANVRTWSTSPFFWTAGFCMIMGATLAGGGCLVLQEVFEPGEALRLIEAERVTFPQAWAHQLVQLEEHPDWASRDLSSVRQAESYLSFGRHKTVHLDDVWSAYSAYGMSETFTIVSAVPANSPPVDRDGHNGRLLPGNALRIIDPASGKALPEGCDGQIAVKGPTLMKGYLKALPEECFDAEGFFRTGDSGFVDDQGRLHWTGRTSELIKTGGANVSPAEIEEALVRHPGLKVALAVGVPDPLLGQSVVVCAVAQDGVPVDEDEVRGFLRGRLASYKVPRRVLFFDESDLSITGSGKVRGQPLRALALARLALEVPVPG